MSDALNQELATLQARVAANNTVIGSAIALIQGLKAALDGAIGGAEPIAELQALSAALATQQEALAAAIAANTPA